MTAAITSVFNDGIFAEQFERYRHDPASVDETWRQYFRIAESLFGQPAASPSAAPAAAPSGGATYDVAFLRKVAAAASLQQAIRSYGHYAVQLDSLGTPPPGAEDLSPAFWGLTDADLQEIPGAALGDDRFATAADAIERKREVYAGRIGYEVWHLEVDEEREWFVRAFRDGVLTRPLTPEEKKDALRRLNQVDGLERFLGRVYQGYKRFSVEGTDTLIPMLDEVILE